MADEEQTVFSAYPLDQLDRVKEKGYEYKVVHLVRHAQGTHNLAVLQLGGQDGGPEEEYKNEAWSDARLTELGQKQASSLRPTMMGHRLDVVFVSPLSRAIHTGLLAIPYRQPFVVEDDLRERIGQHPCDRRRTRAEIKADFPEVDVTPLVSEADDKWSPAREPMPDLIARTMRVLHKLKSRPETHIGLVTHNDFLTALLFDAPVVLADPALRKKFGNAEHMALVLTWATYEPAHASSASSVTLSESRASAAEAL